MAGPGGGSGARVGWGGGRAGGVGSGWGCMPPLRKYFQKIFRKICNDISLVSSNRYLADEVSYLATQGDTTRFVEGEYPEGIGQVTNVAVLGLFTSKNSEGIHSLSLFTKVSK